MRISRVLVCTEMDFDANLSTATYESGPCPSDEFPRSSEPVCILGTMYSTLHDMTELKDDIMSRIWCTYRKNFPSIGDTGQTTDTGWGCMLRCGQMMLAQTLVLKHLGRDWRWRPGPGDKKYWRLLRMFQDKKASVFSIQQIASMGESEGKAVGQWFGPNTIAQVLKRIVGYDDWSDVAIHVALDNTVIEEEIRELCCQCKTKEQDSAMVNGDGRDIGGESFSRFVNDPMPEGEGSDKRPEGQGHWKSLLLIVPLRLGLTDINPIYFGALKKCLSLRQSVGIIGGKPNHAHFFVGFVGDEMVYLDPHTTQLVCNLDDSGEQAAGDQTYHCAFACRMNMNRLDPSIAVGFYCDTEKDFEELCQSLRAFSKLNKDMMFEICKDRPPHLQYNFDAVTPSLRKSGVAGMRVSDASGSSVDEEEFEIL